MTYFAISTAVAAFFVVLVFVCLMFLTNHVGLPAWMKLEDWENVAAGLALLALPVAFAGSVVVIKIAQLATEVADNQRVLLEQQVRLQAQQLLHGDLAIAGERAEAVIAWRAAWRRALDQFWRALAAATQPPPVAPPIVEQPALGMDDDLVPAGSLANGDAMPHERVLSEWEGATSAARRRVGEALRTLRRLERQSKDIIGLDDCIREQLVGAERPFTLLGYCRAEAASSGEAEASERGTPTRLFDLLPRENALLARLGDWWRAPTPDDAGAPTNVGPSVLSLVWAAHAMEEEEWLRHTRETYWALWRLFGLPGALHVSVLAAVAERPEGFVIAHTPHAPENAVQVSERIRAAFARAAIGDELDPEVQSWADSIAAYGQADPRRMSGVPEHEWHLCEGQWHRLLSAEACKLIDALPAAKG